jgi:hypothetical protein
MQNNISYRTKKISDSNYVTQLSSLSDHPLLKDVYYKDIEMLDSFYQNGNIGCDSSMTKEDYNKASGEHKILKIKGNIFFYIKEYYFINGYTEDPNIYRSSYLIETYLLKEETSENIVFSKFAHNKQIYINDGTYYINEEEYQQELYDDLHRMMKADSDLILAELS